MSEDGRTYSCKSFIGHDSEFGDNESVLTTTEDAVHMDVNKLKMEVALMRIEMNDRKNEATRTDEPRFKSSISGSWRIVDSHNVAEYLRAQGASDLINTIFQLANAHLEFDGDVGTLYYQVGEKKHYVRSFELSKPQFFGNISSVSYISDCILKTVYLRNESEEEAEKRFLRDGRLHVEMKRNGVECTRVYGKIAEDGKIGGEVVGKDSSVLREENKTLSEEIGALRAKIAELTDELAVYKKKETSEAEQLELCSAILKKLRNFESTSLSRLDRIDVNSSRILSLTYQLDCQPNGKLKQKLVDVSLQRYGSDGKKKAEEKISMIEQQEVPLEKKQEMLEKEMSEVESDPTFIKNSIRGKWENVNNSSDIRHYKVEDNQFMRKWNNYVNYDVDTFGVPDSGKCFYVVENNKIVRKQVGDPNWRYDFFIEGDQLVIFNNFGNKRHVHKKIGDAD